MYNLVLHATCIYNKYSINKNRIRCLRIGTDDANQRSMYVMSDFDSRSMSLFLKISDSYK